MQISTLFKDMIFNQVLFRTFVVYRSLNSLNTAVLIYCICHETCKNSGILERIW